MKAIETKRQLSSSKGLHYFLIILITLGVIFRFVNIDQKLYWADEAFTSLRISGYTLETVAKEVYKDQVISVEDFQKYQRLSPSKSVNDTVKGLIDEEPQLTPLYFIMARFWAQGFGDSVTAIRSLSAVFGSLAVLAMYWLCLELFNSPLSAWIGAALISVSPFHVLYSQEARPYSLLTLLILLSSSILLRSLRQPTFLNWGLYSLTVAVGLYSHLFFALTLLSHGAYVLLRERLRVGKILIIHSLALALGTVTFIPWLAVIAAHQHQVQTMTSWADEKLSLFNLIKVWAGNVSRLFLDFGISSSLALFNISLAIVLPVLLLVLLSLYALYFTYRRASPKIWLFAFSLIGITLLLIWVPDIFSGERQSTAPRYSISLFLGIQLSIVYLLSTKIADKTFEPTDVTYGLQSSSSYHSSLHLKQYKNLIQRNLWSLLMFVIFFCSILSCSLSLPSQIWWSKAPQYTRHIPSAAASINQEVSPLVISMLESDGDLMRVESLSRLLKPDIKLQFFAFSNTLNTLNTLNVDRNTFIYLPNIYSQEILEDLRQKIERTTKGKLMLIPSTDNMLFKLKVES